MPGYAAVVWVGHPEPDARWTASTGGGLPAQIWQRYMSVAMEGREVEDFPKPPDDLLRPRESTGSPADG